MFAQTRSSRFRQHPNRGPVTHQVGFLLAEATANFRRQYSQVSPLLRRRLYPGDGEQFFYQNGHSVGRQVEHRIALEEVDHRRDSRSPGECVQRRHRTDRLRGGSQRTGYCGRRQASGARPLLRRPSQPVKLRFHPPNDGGLLLFDAFRHTFPTCSQQKAICSAFKQLKVDRPAKLQEVAVARFNQKNSPGAGKPGGARHYGT